MIRLRISATECNYSGIDRQLKEQFIYGLNDNKDVTSYQVVTLARQVEAQRTHTAVLSDLKVYQQFNAI